MAIGSVPVGNYKNLTASANVLPRDGCMLGFFCSTTSSGTVQFYDSATTTTTTPITAVITLTAGTWYPLPFILTNGLYAAIGSTANITVCSL